MLAGRVNVELPVSVAEVIEDASEGVERFTGEAGLLIMKAVMDAEVESLAGPKGKHDPARQRSTTHPRSLILGLVARNETIGRRSRMTGVTALLPNAESHRCRLLFSTPVSAHCVFVLGTSRPVSMAPASGTTTFRASLWLRLFLRH